MIQIEEVKNSSDLKKFVKFPFKLYKDSKYWVPPIIREEINIFNSNVNPTLKDANLSLYIAIIDNEIVRRIAAIINSIEVNEQKTKAVIFGSDDKNKGNDNNLSFSINGKHLEIVDSYCYLGIILHKSGKLTEAKSSLKTKAMRAFYGLKRTINRTKLSFRALSTLFDSLIKPIILYGSPIWTPYSPIIKTLANAAKSPQAVQNIIPKIGNKE